MAVSVVHAVDSLVDSARTELEYPAQAILLPTIVRLDAAVFGEFDMRALQILSKSNESGIDKLPIDTPADRTRGSD